MKRAHLRALVGARALTYRSGLTPARHDLLRVIEAFGFGGEAYQTRMWKALGLSRASVSRMVRRLLALGLLQRRRAPLDRRTFLVSMTRYGEQCMHRAHCIILKRKPFQRRFERAFGERSWETVAAVQNLVDGLELTARHLGDTSAKLYRTKAPAPPPMLPSTESPRAEALAELSRQAPPSPRVLERARLWHEAEAREHARRRERDLDAVRARAAARAARRARARDRAATQLATEPATQLAAEPATQLATEPATQLATEPATQLATLLATEPATQLATEPETQLAAEPATQLAAERATEPATQSSKRSAT